MGTNKKKGNYQRLCAITVALTHHIFVCIGGKKTSRLRLKKATSDQKSLPRMARMARIKKGNYQRLCAISIALTHHIFVCIRAIRAIRGKKQAACGSKKGHQWH